jgi:hypothetical protein
VVWVAAVANPAEVVQLKSGRNAADQFFVGDSMDVEHSTAYSYARISFRGLGVVGQPAGCRVSSLDLFDMPSDAL